MNHNFHSINLIVVYILIIYDTNYMHIKISIITLVLDIEYDVKVQITREAHKYKSIS